MSTARLHNHTSRTCPSVQEAMQAVHKLEKSASAMNIYGQLNAPSVASGQRQAAVESVELKWSN